MQKNRRHYSTHSADEEDGGQTEQRAHTQAAVQQKTKENQVAEPYLGQIIMFAGNFAPSGWALCNGQLLPISQNAALFSILGTTYGGDGITTFALPNLQGRVPEHWGTGPGLPAVTIGESGGSTNVSILTSNLPQHAHPIAQPVSSAAGTAQTPVNSYPAVDTATATFTPPSTHGTVTVSSYASASTANQTMAPFVSGMAGGGIPISVQQPYLAVTFVIALQGIFPSRG
jgi:microcystin-dependent protein